MTMYDGVSVTKEIVGMLDQWKRIGLYRSEDDEEKTHLSVGVYQSRGRVILRTLNQGERLSYGSQYTEIELAKKASDLIADSNSFDTDLYHTLVWFVGIEPEAALMASLS